MDFYKKRGFDSISPVNLREKETVRWDFSGISMYKLTFISHWSKIASLNWRKRTQP